MPECPKCKKKYLLPRETCKFCGALLNEQESLSENTLDGPAYLLETANEFEAEIVQAMLEAEGIPVHLEHNMQSIKSLMGIDSFEVKVYVPAAALERAREIIAAGPGEGFDQQE